jgi:hypothetical protein
VGLGSGVLNSEVSLIIGRWCQVQTAGGTCGIWWLQVVPLGWWVISLDTCGWY